MRTGSANENRTRQLRPVNEPANTYVWTTEDRARRAADHGRLVCAVGADVSGARRHEIVPERASSAAISQGTSAP
jgi:hypothetical protein